MQIYSQQHLQEHNMWELPVYGRPCPEVCKTALVLANKMQEYCKAIFLFDDKKWKRKKSLQ